MKNQLAFALSFEKKTIATFEDSTNKTNSNKKMPSWQPWCPGHC